jgi:hypothetical protein
LHHLDLWVGVQYLRRSFVVYDPDQSSIFVARGADCGSNLVAIDGAMPEGVVGQCDAETPEVDPPAEDAPLARPMGPLCFALPAVVGKARQIRHHGPQATKHHQLDSALYVAVKIDIGFLVLFLHRNSNRALSLAILQRPAECVFSLLQVQRPRPVLGMGLKVPLHVALA